MSAQRSNKKSAQIKKSVARGKKAAKKVKKHKKLALGLIILVVLLIAAIAVTYIVKPALFDPLLDYFASLAGGGDGGKGSAGAPGITPIDGQMLELTAIDVGQGDCIYIEFPDGKNMMVDCGSEFGTPSPWNTVSAFLKEREVGSLDWLMLTHTDYDHVREAKKLVENLEIRQFFLPDVPFDAVTKTWENFGVVAQTETYTENGETRKAQIRYNVGDFSIAGENWRMDCHSYLKSDYPKVTEKSSAETKNAISPVCVLTYAQRSVVLTGDANFDTEEYLLATGRLNGVDADVLKVGHHGSKTSTSRAFLDAIDAEYAIISTNGSSYGHPTPELLARLEEYRDWQLDGDFDGFDQIFRTDMDGSVTVQIGYNGVMNLISAKRGDNNRTLTEVTAVFADGTRVTLFFGRREEAA